VELKQIELFESFTDGQLAQVSEIAERVSFSAREAVFRVGDKSEDFFILVEGQMHVEIPQDEESSLVSVLTPMAIFGEVGLLQRIERSASVVADEDGQTLRIKNADFLELLQGDADMAAKFYRSLSRVLFERLANTTEDLTLVQTALSS
jgi:CRP-like cAMP-binding protein